MAAKIGSSVDAREAVPETNGAAAAPAAVVRIAPRLVRVSVGNVVAVADGARPFPRLAGVDVFHRSL